MLLPCLEPFGKGLILGGRGGSAFGSFPPPCSSGWFPLNCMQSKGIDQDEGPDNCDKDPLLRNSKREEFEFISASARIWCLALPFLAFPLGWVIPSCNPFRVNYFLLYIVKKMIDAENHPGKMGIFGLGSGWSLLTPLPELVWKGQNGQNMDQLPPFNAWRGSKRGGMDL